MSIEKAFVIFAIIELIIVGMLMTGSVLTVIILTICDIYDAVKNAVKKFHGRKATAFPVK